MKLSFLKEFLKELIKKFLIRIAKLIYVTPPNQGTWRSNDYVSTVWLIDYGCFKLGEWSCIST